MEDFVEIKHKHFSFMITKNPSNAGFKSYIKELKKRNVSAVIRACKPSYEAKHLVEEGIQVYDLDIEDGGVPNKSMLQMFFNIIKKHYCEHPESSVAIHCVFGLGRAPVLVAIALIELGYTYDHAITLIRSKRRGSFNYKQLNYLRDYKPKSRLKIRRKGTVMGKISGLFC